MLIGCDEFPVGYSLAGCPPAEPASASPTGDDSQQSTLPYNDFSANGNYPLNFVSHSKGALQSPVLPSHTPGHDAQDFLCGLAAVVQRVNWMSIPVELLAPLAIAATNLSFSIARTTKRRTRPTAAQLRPRSRSRFWTLAPGWALARNWALRRRDSGRGNGCRTSANGNYAQRLSTATAETRVIG